MIGREYWVEGALRSPLAIGQEDIRGRLFCSYLVAEAYRQVGLDFYEAADHELRGIVRLIDGTDPTTLQTEFP